MKKILITLLFCATALSVFAQKKVSWGIKGGVNIGELKNNEYDSDKDYGVVFGVLVELPLKNNFSILGELNYYAHQSKDKIPIYGAGKRSRTLNFEFIQIPTLIKYNLINKLSIESGSAFNFLLKDEVILHLSYDDIINKDVVRDFQISGVIGTTYTFKNGFFAGVRYHHSIGDVFKNNTSGQKLISAHFYFGKRF